MSSAAIWGVGSDLLIGVVGGIVATMLWEGHQYYLDRYSCWPYWISFAPLEDQSAYQTMITNRSTRQSSFRFAIIRSDGLHDTLTRIGLPRWHADLGRYVSGADGKPMLVGFSPVEVAPKTTVALWLEPTAGLRTRVVALSVSEIYHDAAGANRRVRLSKRPILWKPR
jgi:hypothetical protein